MSAIASFYVFLSTSIISLLLEMILIIASFKLHLNAYFHMKDLGSLKYFFGIELA